MMDRANIATDLTIKGILRTIRNLYTSKKEMEDFRNSINDDVSSQLKEHNETIVKNLTQENADNAEKAARSEVNTAASEKNAKLSEENALMSEASSRVQAKLAEKWAIGEESPNGEFDKDSKDGRTHSSKSWAQQAKEEALTATDKVKEVSEFAKGVKAALEEAQELQTATQNLRSDVDTIMKNAADMMTEFRGIRDSLSDAVLYKGTVETYADLPTEALLGWMYSIQKGEPAFNINDGDNVIWNGKDWDNIGSFLNVDEILKTSKDAVFGKLSAKTVQADTVTANVNGTASRAVIAESAESVEWNKVKNKPASMPANGGTADRALKADACTGNAASASSVAWGNVTGKPAIPSTAVATASANGLMSAADKNKLNNIGGAVFATTTQKNGKIKININAATAWMLNFTVILYQSYVAQKVMISGYNYGTNHWHAPDAKLISSSNNAAVNVYFGYDADWKLWVGFDATDYTGVAISDVCNGFNKISDFTGLFTISTMASLTGTSQASVTAQPPLHAGNYNNYAPTKTGGGASGTWGINITGNAGTASKTISAGVSTTWIDGRNEAPFKMSQSDGNYKAAISAKTKNGSWDFGTYVDNIAHFSYITDDDYNKRNNAQTCDIAFKPSGEIQANAFRGRFYGTADAANSVAWGNVSGKPSTFTPSSHNHGLIHDSQALGVADKAANNWATVGANTSGYVLRSLRCNNTGPAYLVNNYGSGIVFGGADTKGVVSVAYNTPLIKFAGGGGTQNNPAPTWWLGVTGNNGGTYNLQDILNRANNAQTTANGKMATAGGTFTGNITAPQLYTPNWFRATGNGGIYWEKYGGGWFMQDTTWVRAYNGKSIYTAGQICADNNIYANKGLRCKAIDGSMWNGWNQCIRFETGSHAAIFNPTGGAFIGLNQDKNIYFGNSNDKKYYCSITPNGFSGALAGNASSASVSIKLRNYGNGTNGALTGSANDAIFHWYGMGGQPTWLWGGNTATDMYVYNPSNFRVSYAASAGSVAWTGISGRPGSILRVSGWDANSGTLTLAAV